MSYQDKGSRSASSEDVCPCPECGQKKNIVVKWKRSEHEEIFQVGCETCENYVAAQDWSLAYVEWNIKVFDSKGNSGNPNKEHIYRLLHRKFLMQQEIKCLDKEIDNFVTSKYMPKFPLKVGDRFETFYSSAGKWEIVDVTAKYGVNTGQFYIIKVVELLSSGRAGRRTREFWSNRIGKFRLLDNFVPATKWSMVVSGDPCKLDGVKGNITEVDSKRKRALVEIEGGKKTKIKNLRNLKVDKCRLR